MNLYQILVPTKINNPDGTIRFAKTKHHKEWDKWVYKMTGGITILSPAKGKWVHTHNAETEVIEERVIPVLIACSEAQIRKIALFTKKHYCQHKVFYFRISTETYIV